jgi:hypothetical protein
VQFGFFILGEGGRDMKSYPQKFVTFIIIALFVVSCGGGDSSGVQSTDDTTFLDTVEESITIDSKSVGVTYSISIGLPPGYDDSGPPYAAIFLLDGDCFFNGFYSSYDEDDDFILIGINNSDRRYIDYLPPVNCDIEVGNRGAFFNFLVSELVPYLDDNYNINPAQRLLFGHSHGGSFVFYTLFEDHGQTFPLLFSNDASLQGWDTSAMGKPFSYPDDGLPVIFYSSAATEGNADVIRPIMKDITSANYAGLITKYETIQGSHDGILDEAFSRGFAWIEAQIEGQSD